ncbi:MAG TPA: TIGR03663 family protein [Planctomycetota bacterium]|mgnify:CR=1 FL=1|nr:TIGR03663 family protein [Planctomycetota bacterium]HRR81090.1 TIGR03663 family protein [Planctomycetota bacterium]HRT94352.1 TIGR03663 family protein [Planctomycetota bacterium]
MTRRTAAVALILAVAAGALAFRLPRLALRPLHCDEAVEAVKTGILFDTGVYRYDPHEYHGPTLHYATVPFLWLSGARSFADSSETTYRLVSVTFGVGLILLLLLVGDGLGWPAAAVAGALLAISPAMVFYHRYYIHEPLLVFFTAGAIGAGWRYARSGRLGWALAAGACLALMHATKETCVLAFAAMGLALAAKLAWRKLWGETIDLRGLLKARHLALAAAAAIAVSVTLFSSFFTHWRGPLDSILTYKSYLTRSGGAGAHDHPWHYYLGTLAYARYGRGAWWSEGLILALALVGFVAALWPRRSGERLTPLPRFLAFYTLFLTAIYAAIPYKTPWCALSFLHGMTLLAGLGAVTLVRRVPTHLLKAAVVLLLAAAGYHLASQAHRAALDRRFVCDYRNPYVYGHTTWDLLEVSRRAEQIAAVHPKGHAMVIKVIASDLDYWPLPFYLRRFPNVGYWDRLPADPDADFVIVSADLADALERRLRGEYFGETRGLRPRVLLRVYIRRDLWNAFIHRQAQAAPGG